MATMMVDGEGARTPESGVYDNAVPEALTRADIERLGRQRPAAFAKASTETFFVITVIVSMMMSEYFISGFNIVLPTIADEINIPAAQRTWPAEAINLTTAALLLPFGRLCDQYGGRVIFLLGHVWLTIWSLVAGFSQNPTMLIVCRAMQGLGSSAFLPAGISLLGTLYRPGPRKNMVFSFYGAMACIGFYIGIFLGAVTGQLLDWRWFFYIGTMLVAINTVIGFLAIPRHLGDGDSSVRMDWLGVATIVPGLVLVVYALTDGSHAPNGWKTPYVIVTFVVGVVLLGIAVYIEGWVASLPLLPGELFRPKYMKRLTASMFCSYGAFALFLFYSSYQLQTVLTTTPLQTAAWFTPLAVGGMFLAIMGGLVLHLLPGRILLIISGLGYLISVLLFALMPPRSESGEPSLSHLYWAYVFPAMICGTIGVDILYNVTNVFITTAMPSRLQATAGALINSLLYLGMAFWLGIGELAVSTTVDYRGEENISLREQYQIGFWVAVGLAGVALSLNATINLGEAAAEMTADEKEKEKARLEQDQ
ncbi:putative Major facilitator superfamily (MFS) profile domain-containing protein [Seiridium cardinale]|uniref:Major facilitator superfamily (MFS) profile domain-containing protein n=1 Tax=Seiridium cardinale TaxID=138064 RepID=A0ABR2XLP0_9PEZI